MAQNSTGPYAPLPDQALKDFPGDMADGFQVDAIPGPTGGGESRNANFALGAAETRNQ